MEGVVLLSPYLKFSVFFQGVDGGFRPNANGEFEAGGNANVILYVGLGMVAVGLVITFVGLGDKGFQTLELKLIGPTLTGIGLFFALLRVLFCTTSSAVLSRAIRSNGWLKPSCHCALISTLVTSVANAPVPSKSM